MKKEIKLEKDLEKKERILLFDKKGNALLDENENHHYRDRHLYFFRAGGFLVITDAGYLVYFSSDRKTCFPQADDLATEIWDAALAQGEIPYNVQ